MDIYRRLRFLRFVLWVVSIFVIVLLLALVFYIPNYYKAEAINEPRPGKVTLNTARIGGADPVETAVAVAQNIYPATFEDNKPNGIILVPDDDWRAAVLAAEIIHFPVNAPILYIKRDAIPEQTIEEIKRLDPQGIFLDGNIKVLVIGDVERKVLEDLKSKKLKYRQLRADSTEELASLLDDYKAMFHIDHDDQVIIVPMERPEYAIQADSWVAHAGHSIFFVGNNGISNSLRKSLEKRPQHAYIYVLADAKTIPEEITVQLSQYGHVQRIPGNDPYEMSVGFAGYKDVGPNLGLWIERDTRTFGWGISEAGHNFTLVNPDHPLLAIPSAALSHKGKHGPFLFIKKDEIPDPVIKFLKTLQPTYLTAQEQLFNHGWIIGDDKIISAEVQNDVDKLLAVKR